MDNWEQFQNIKKSGDYCKALEIANNVVSKYKYSSEGYRWVEQCCILLEKIESSAKSLAFLEKQLNNYQLFQVPCNHVWVRLITRWIKMRVAQNTAEYRKIDCQMLAVDLSSRIPLVEHSFCNRRVVIVDTETTGFSPYNDSVIEIAVIHLDCNVLNRSIIKILDVYSSLRDPGRSIPYKASVVNNITDAMVKDVRIDADKLNKIFDDSAYAIAHNQSFDHKFIDAMPEIILPKRLEWRCSYRSIPWKRNFGLPNCKLDTIRNYLKINSSNAHTAIDDAFIVAAVINDPIRFGHLLKIKSEITSLSSNSHVLSDLNTRVLQNARKPTRPKFSNSPTRNFASHSSNQCNNTTFQYNNKKRHIPEHTSSFQSKLNPKINKNPYLFSEFLNTVGIIAVVLQILVVLLFLLMCAGILF